MSSKFTNTEFVKYVTMLEQRNVPYWYGTCGYKCTEDLLTRKAKQYPKHYGSERMSKYRKAIKENKICCDCIGMIKSFFWSDGGDGILNYLDGKGDYTTKYESNNCPDTSANGFYEYCRKHAPKKYWSNINDMPDIPGIAVFMPGHVGLYVGGGWVIEARGFAYGVVKTRLDSRPWKTAAMLPDDMLEYVGIGDMDKSANETKLGDRLLKRDVKGSDVKELQQKLIKLGYDVGKWQDDGEYGSATANAVKAFQRDHKLSADGMYGPKTHKVMMAL